MKIVNPKREYTYEDMLTDIELLQSCYPDLLEVKVIGKSVDGRKIVAIKLGTGETEVFINGSHHAREWLTTSLIMNMIDVYSYSYAIGSKIGNYNVKEILSQCSIWFVPMVNPDGVTLVQNGHLRTKHPTKLLELNNGSQDFSAWKANSRGVDLNRQYPAGWDTIKSDPGRPASMMYKGPKPLSEPETKAVYDFTIKHNFKRAVSYHSSGEEIFWQYKSNGSLYQSAKRLATKISEKTGYQMIFPGPNPSGGGYTDWFLESVQKPAVTLEISPLVGPRPVPLRNYDKIWKDNKEIGLMIAQDANEN